MEHASPESRWKSFTKHQSQLYSSTVCQTLNGIHDCYKLKPHKDQLSEDQEPKVLDRNYIPKNVPMIKKSKAASVFKKESANVRSRSSVSLKSKSSVQEHELRKKSQKVGPFYPLQKWMGEKEIDEADIISFFRSKKHDEEIHRSQNNKGCLKDPQHKKLNFAIDKKLPNHTFNYQGEIIPIAPVLTKKEENRYVDVETHVHSEPKNELQEYVPERAIIEESSKVVYPPIREQEPLEMESKFHKNFKTLNLNKNVAVVSKPYSPQRQAKPFSIDRKQRVNIFKGKKNTKGSKQESIKIIMDKEQSKSVLGIWEFENEDEQNLSLELQLENLPTSEKILKKFEEPASFLRRGRAQLSSFCHSSKLFKKKKVVKFNQ